MDSPPACNNIKMEETAAPFLRFEWEGGCSIARRVAGRALVGSVAVHHGDGPLRQRARLYCSGPDMLLRQRDFWRRLGPAAIRTLERFGWLIRPTKCVGVSSAVQVFTALGTPALVAGRSLHERRAAGRGSHPHRDRRLLASGRALLVDTSLGRVNGCRIGSTPLALRFDSVTERDASDTGFGAVTFVEGLAEASWGPPLPWSPRCWHMPGAPRPSGRATSGQTSSMPLPLQSTFSTPDAPCCSYTVSHRSCSASPPSSRGAATRLSWTTWGVSSSWGGLVPLFASGARRPTGLPTWKA